MTTKSYRKYPRCLRFWGHTRQRRGRSNSRCLLNPTFVKFRINQPWRYREWIARCLVRYQVLLKPMCTFAGTDCGVCWLVEACSQCGRCLIEPVCGKIGVYRLFSRKSIRQSQPKFIGDKYPSNDLIGQLCFPAFLKSCRISTAPYENTSYRSVLRVQPDPDRGGPTSELWRPAQLGRKHIGFNIGL